MTTGKTIALTIWTFVSKGMSVLFNMLSRFIIAFLSRNKCLLISWLKSLSTVILEPKERKSVTQFSSVAHSCLTLCDVMDCIKPGLPVHPQLSNLLKFMSIELAMPSNNFILRSPLLLPPSIFPSIRVFSNESTLHMRWSKYWSFSVSIIPSKEIPGLISFRMDWLDLLAVQGTLKSLLQHHSLVPLLCSK